MKIATWNVNGIRARQAQVLDWIRNDRPDVVCLQEIKATPEQVPEPLRSLPDYWCYWHGERAYSGVGLHIRRDLAAEAPRFEHPDFNFETRIAVVQIGKLRIGSVYVPNGGKDYAAKLRFLEAMERYAGACRASGMDLILCGDMNVTRTDQDVHPKERKPNVIGQRPDERELFERVLANGGLVDIGRALDPDNDQLFTWWPPWRGMRQKNIGWRLDYVLASQSIAGQIHQCSVLAELGTSDHAPVVAEFTQD
ncbi:MAG: exodeoxyribonuclease III [Acidobacteriota bacterium]|jgi:exodeoxyribonuclease-3|nr:exodeoxyribonuclease III [Acidobacteriota bacterium]